MEKKSSKKISYVYRVPGKDLMVIAGFFESAGAWRTGLTGSVHSFSQS